LLCFVVYGMFLRRSGPPVDHRIEEKMPSEKQPRKNMDGIQERMSQTGELTYRVRIRLKGHPIQTKTFDRLTDARRWKQETEVKLKEGRYFKSSEAQKRTLEVYPMSRTENDLV